jgi:hypothetical protein
MNRIDNNPYLPSVSLLFTLLFNNMDQSLLEKLTVAQLVEIF